MIHQFWSLAAGFLGRPVSPPCGKLRTLHEQRRIDVAGPVGVDAGEAQSVVRPREAEEDQQLSQEADLAAARR